MNVVLSSNNRTWLLWIIGQSRRKHSPTVAVVSASANYHAVLCGLKVSDYQMLIYWAIMKRYHIPVMPFYFHTVHMFRL